MGYNSTVVVMNDSLHTIAKDKNFGRNLELAILTVGRGEMVDVVARDDRRTYCNAATVIETHHADTKTLIAVGGNTGEIVSAYAGSYTADKLSMLKKLADDMGFTLRKKPVKRTWGKIKKS
jgi:hypothetical protein